MLRYRKTGNILLALSVTVGIFFQNAVFAEEPVKIIVTDSGKNIREVVYTESNNIPHNVSLLVKGPTGEAAEIVFTDQRMSDENGETIFEFSISGNAPSGTYSGLIKSERRQETVAFSIYHADDEYKKDIIEDMLDTSELDMPAFLIKYTTEIPVFTVRSTENGYISEIASILYDNISGYTNMEYTETVALLAASEALNELNKAEDTEQLNVSLVNNSDVLSIEINDDYKKLYTTVCEKLLEHIKSEQGLTLHSELCSEYNTTLALATINSITSTSEMTRAITEYAEIIGIDIEEYSEQDTDKVNRALIGKNFKTADEVLKAYENGKAVQKDDKKPSSSVTGGGGGGGGGSSSSASSAGGFTVPNITAVDNSTPKFFDLYGFEWAQEAIEGLAEQEIVSGTEDGIFSPAASIKREEFVKMIVLAFDVYDKNAQCDFTDVEETAWYYSYVASAVKSGIVNGISDTNFGTGQNITREQMAAIVYRTLQATGKALEVSEPQFGDADSISEYAIEAVGALNAAGILEGDENGNFNPGSPCRRAEAAKVLYEILR